jgi:hypothetical protein
LEGNVRRQRLSPAVEEGGVPTTTNGLVNLVDVHLTSTRAASNFHRLRVPLGTNSLGKSIRTSLLVSELSEEERESVALRCHEGLGTSESPEESLVPRSPGNTANHSALAGSNTESHLPGARRSAVLVGVNSKAVGNKRTVTTDNGLHESLTTTSTIDLTNEDLGGLRNTSKLLELLKLVPSSNVEATVEASPRREGGSNATLSVGGISSTSVRAEVSRIVGLVPDGETTSTMSNEDRNNATNELREILRLRIQTSRISAWLVVEHGSTPSRSNASNGELDTERTSSSSLHEVDVAIKLLQGQRTTARVKEVEVEHRAYASSSKSLDLIKSSLTLGVVNVEERSLILSAEFNAVVVSGEATREAASPDLLHVNPMSNRARPSSILPCTASPEGGDNAVNSISEGSNTTLSRAEKAIAMSPLTTRESSPSGSLTTTNEALVVLGETPDIASEARYPSPVPSPLLNLGSARVKTSNTILNTLDARLYRSLPLRSKGRVSELSTKACKTLLSLTLASAEARKAASTTTTRPTSPSAKLINTSLSLSNTLLKASNSGTNAISHHR